MATEATRQISYTFQLGAIGKRLVELLVVCGSSAILQIWALRCRDAAVSFRSDTVLRQDPALPPISLLKTQAMLLPLAACDRLKYVGMFGEASISHAHLRHAVNNIAADSSALQS